MEKGLHVGIILDGNRRFAKNRGLRPWDGHREGARKVEELFDWCGELNVKELTLYAFSIENFNRARREVEFLFSLFKEQINRLDNVLFQKIEKNRIRVRFIGRLNMFPDDIVERMNKLMDKTRHNDERIINFAMAYGGRAEIVDAVRQICKKVKKDEISLDEIDEDLISKNLYLKEEPDLVIRPGGEKRVSNFLLWQVYYSEWFFCDKLWPEFTKEDLRRAIEDFKKRDRRFGR